VGNSEAGYFVHKIFRAGAKNRGIRGKDGRRLHIASVIDAVF